MEHKSNYIPFIAQRIQVAKKQLLDVKEKADPNKMTVKVDPLAKPKLEGEELQRHLNDRTKGGGFHKNVKDKRSKNPNKNNDGW